MAKIKSLPKTLFVKIEQDGGTTYFTADTEMYGMVEMGQKVQIGKYQLVETTDAEAVVKTSPPRKR